MKGLVAAEVLKVRTTRTWAALLLVALLLTAFSLVVTLVAAGTELGEETGIGDPSSESAARSLLGSAGGGALLAAVLGVLAVTGEHRHGTVTRTYLGEPRRERVVAAKLLALLGWGAAFGLVLAAFVLLVGYGGLVLRGADLSEANALAAPLLLGAVAGTALYAVLGVGVGALVRHQVAAVVAVIGSEVLLAPLLVALVPDVGRWLPGGALAAVVGGGTAPEDLLAPWAGALVLLAYALLASAAAVALDRRRDIT